MADRELSPTREATTPRTTGTTQAPDRTLADVRQPIEMRSTDGRTFVADYQVDPNYAPPDLSWAAQPLVNTASNPSLDTTNQSSAPTTLYGTANPYAILGDLFSRAFGGGSPQDEQQQSQFVPVVSSSGGGGNAAIVVFILLAAIGAGYYFFVYRKREA